MATATVSVPALHLPSIATTTSSSQVPQCGGGGNGCTPRGRSTPPFSPYSLIFHLPCSAAVLKDGWMEKKGARVKKWYPLTSNCLDAFWRLFYFDLFFIFILFASRVRLCLMVSVHRRRRYFLLFSDPRELRYFDGEKLKGTIDMGTHPRPLPNAVI